MDCFNFLLSVLIYALLTQLSNQQNVFDEIELRKEVNAIAQEFLVKQDPFHHSYVFNSGIGNREEIHINSFKRDNQFTAGEGVLAWQTIQNGGNVYLLGRKLRSLTLIVSKSHLNFIQSANFTEHTLELGVKISSTSLFTRIDSTNKTEVAVGVSLNNSTSFDIVFFKATSSGKLIQISEPWTYCNKIDLLSVITVKETNHLVIVNSGSQSTVELFEIKFKVNNKNIDLRSVQHWTLEGSCTSVTVCRVHQRMYLLFVQPELQFVAVYSLANMTETYNFQPHKPLFLPQVTQLVTFSVASEVYIAVNGQGPHVLRISKSGVFVSELSLDHVDEWLAVPLESYRRDIVLFGRTDGVIRSYVWAGSNLGFISLEKPQGINLLQGNWSGAAPVSFWNQNGVILPGEPKQSSNLIIIEHSLHPKANPVREKLLGVIRSISFFKETLQDLKESIAEAENTLRHVVRPNSTIFAKWKLHKLSTQMLSLNTMVQPKAETDQAEIEARREPLDMDSLETVVTHIENSVDTLKFAVDKKEKKLWSLKNFKGKVSFNEFTVDNLTISQLNGVLVDSFLHNIFRKDKPKPIVGLVVVEESVAVDHLSIEKLNNHPADVLKFNDEDLILTGNLTFLSPVTVKNSLNLKNGGEVNGKNLAKYLCGEDEQCLVSPVENEDESENMVKRNSPDFENTHWNIIHAGKNLTIKQVNGVDWDLLVENLVFLDTQQNISGTLIINGTLTSDLPIWTGNTYKKLNSPSSDDYKASESHPSVRVAVPDSPDETERFQGGLKTNPNTVTIITNLEVTGRIICNESIGRPSVSDAISEDADTNNIAGSENVHVMKASGTSHAPRVGSSAERSASGKMEVNTLRVLNSINGIPISELVATDNNGVTVVKVLKAHLINVANNITVNGKLCNQDLHSFEKRRLSLKRDQSISGPVTADVVTINNGFVKSINEKEISSYLTVAHFNATDTINISELFVSENITTSNGVNGQNVSDIAANAVKLSSNNYINNIIFKDTVVFDILDCQGYLNNEPCQNWFNETDIVSKSAKFVTFSGEKKFLNTLTINEDLQVNEINGHNLKNVLTKHSEQAIRGDIFVVGDVEINEDSILAGLFNNQNLTEFVNKCTLEGHTISCKGNAEFKAEVSLNNFHSSGKINNLNFEEFVESLVDREGPEPLTVFKNFTNKSVHVKDLYVHTINNQTWDDFVTDAVMQHGYECINSEVTFNDQVTINTLNVDFNLDSSTINSVDVSQWGSSAIYINENFNLNIPLHLASASSLGSLSVVTYEDVNMLNMDLVKLRGNVMMSSPRFKSVQVTHDIDIVNTVNGHQLAQLERNMLKVSGSQTVWSNLDVGEVFVTGNVTTNGLVNMQNLNDVVTLSSDQTLHGNYQFACVEAEEDMQVEGTVSGVNMSEWAESAVQRDGDQLLTGHWRVQGEMRARAGVSGPGKLADVNLKELETNVTKQIVHVHQKMKAQLSLACEATNQLIPLARNQTATLLYLDITQDIYVPLGPSFVSHFKSGDGNYLAICEKGCLTIIYKWSKNIGQFTELHSAILDSSIKQLATLQHNQLTYLITDSSVLNNKCQYKGKNAWLFTENKIKHTTALDLDSSSSFEVYDNELYVMSYAGLYKLSLKEENDAVTFTFQAMNVHYDIDMWLVPNTAGLGLAVENEHLFVSLNPNINLSSNMFDNCTKETHSFAVDPFKEFIAIASTEKTEVPRYSDHIKIYRLGGSLFDKVSASNVSHLQWISVPGQTWFVFSQNMTSLQLYQLADETAGFKLKVSTEMELKDMKSVSLPLKSKVNLQPFLIVQADSAVKIVQIVFEGDPYMGQELFCNFDDALKTIPGVL